MNLKHNPKELSNIVLVNHHTLTCAAFRYALGRRSTIVGTVVDEILNNWGKLNEPEKEMMVKEIKEAIVKNQAGQECDVEQWNKIVELWDKGEK